MNLIGTDEAGYGPNYGPLVVSGTSWKVKSPHQLRKFVDEFGEAGFPIGDSKTIFHAGNSIATLETVVLGALWSLATKKHENAQDLINFVCGQNSIDLGPANRPVAIPVAAEPERIDQVLQRFRQSGRIGVHLKGFQARMVFPEEFNRLLESSDSKGAMLSEITLQLLQESWCSTEQNFQIFCDKHGGRNRYLDLLNKFYPDEMIWVDHESRESSVYRFKSSGRSVEARFIAKGESETPIALASMISKYLRELSMLSFNAFWQEHLPELRATAGYPEDAKRFKRDIAEVQKKLGIGDDLIWRKK